MSGGFRGSEWWKYDGFHRVTASGTIVPAGGIPLVEQSLGPGEWRVRVKLAAIADTTVVVDPSQIYAIQLAGTAYDPLGLTRSQTPRQTNEQWFSDQYDFNIAANAEILIKLVLAFPWDYNGLLFGYVQSEGNEFPLPCGCRK